MCRKVWGFESLRGHHSTGYSEKAADREIRGFFALALFASTVHCFKARNFFGKLV